MNKKKKNNLIELLSPLLILSYFLIHNIIFVLVGIAFSLYLLNKDYIKGSLIQIFKFISEVKNEIDYTKNDEFSKIEANEDEFKKEDSIISLVEKIEELGFIPSLDKENDGNAL